MAAGDITFGSEYIFSPGEVQQLSSAMLDATHFVVTYRDYSNSNYGTCQIGTIAGDGSISYGSRYNIESAIASTMPWHSITVIDSTHFVIVYYTNSVDIFSRYATVSSGNVISYGAKCTIASRTNTYSGSRVENARITKLSSTSFLTSYTRVTFNSGGTQTSQADFCKILTLSGTTLTPNTEYSIDSHNYNTYYSSIVDIIAIDSTHAMTIRSSYYNSRQGYINIATISGTAISYGSSSSYTTSASYDKKIIPLSSTTSLLVYPRDNDSNKLYSRICTNSSGTLSFSTETNILSISSYYSLYRVDDTHAVMLYKNASGYPCTKYITAESGSITTGTETVAISSSIANFLSIDGITSEFIITFANSATPFRGRTIVGSIETAVTSFEYTSSGSLTASAISINQKGFEYTSKGALTASSGSINQKGFEYTSSGSIDASSTSVYDYESNSGYNYTSNASLTASSASINQKDFEYTSSGSLTASSASSYYIGVVFEYDSNGVLTASSTITSSLDIESVNSGSLTISSVAQSNSDAIYEYDSNGSLTSSTESVTFKFSTPDYIASGSLNTSSYAATNKNLRYYGYTPKDNFKLNIGPNGWVYGSALTASNTVSVIYNTYPDSYIVDYDITTINRASYIDGSECAITDPSTSSIFVATGNVGGTQYLYVLYSVQGSGTWQLKRYARSGVTWAYVDESITTIEPSYDNSISFFIYSGTPFVVIFGSTSAQIYNVSSTPSLTYTWLYPTTFSTVECNKKYSQSAINSGKFYVTYRHNTVKDLRVEAWDLSSTSATLASNSLVIPNALTNNEVKTATVSLSGYSANVAYLHYTYRDLSTQTTYYNRIIRLALSSGSLTVATNTLLSTGADKASYVQSLSTTHVDISRVLPSATQPYMYNTSSASIANTSPWDYSDVSPYQIVPKSDGSLIYFTSAWSGSEYRLFSGAYGYFLDDEIYYDSNGSLSTSSTSSYEKGYSSYTVVASGSLSASSTLVATLEYQKTVSGSISASSTSSYNRDYSIVATGSISASSTSTSSFSSEYSIINNGSLLASGASVNSVESTELNYTSNGSLTSDSTSSYFRFSNKDYISSGSLITSSTSDIELELDFSSYGLIISSSDIESSIGFEFNGNGALDASSTIISNYGPVIPYESSGSMEMSSTLISSIDIEATSNGSLVIDSVSTNNYTRDWDYVAISELNADSESIYNFLRDWSYSTSGSLSSSSYSTYNYIDFNEYKWIGAGSASLTSDAVYDFIRSWDYVTGGELLDSGAADSLYSKIYDIDGAGSLTTSSTSSYYRHIIKSEWDYTSEGQLILTSSSNSNSEILQTVFCIVPITNIRTASAKINTSSTVSSKITTSRTINLNMMKKQTQGDQ